MSFNIRERLPCGAGSTIQVLLCLFLGVLWLWHFLYSVGPHPVSSLHICTFVVSRAFMAVAASQAGDDDSSRAPGLTSGLQGSVNVHRGALLLVPQWQCISSFVIYIGLRLLRVVMEVRVASLPLVWPSGLGALDLAVDQEPCDVVTVLLPESWTFTLTVGGVFV